MPSTDGAAGTPQELENPAGAFRVSVRTRGAGCPPCTAHTTVAADGQTLTITFDAFEVKPASGASARAACTLALQLRSSVAQAHAVAELSYQGAASLAEGETASQEAQHQLEGRPVSTEDLRIALTGPREGTYGVSAPTEAADLVWSECATERDLTVSTTLALGPSENGESWISLSEAGASLRLKVAARACTP